jgi:uncharacterized Zn finger protein
MSYYGFRPYVPVAKRRAQAAREVEKLKKKGQTVSPVVIEGRKIANNFWGKAWCDNLERYSDYANRLPRGRTYVRNGSVVDLQIERGQIQALVSGSSIYKVKIDIGTVASTHWAAICTDCAGSVGSLVELLQGKLLKNVMERVCREGDGLFPSPREIKLSCSCPDWADMCKHVAAVMYGAGARLDIAPDLLFTLRGVDRSELIANAGAELPMKRTGVASQRILADDDVAALFGVDMAPEPLETPTAKKAVRTKKAAPARRAIGSSEAPAKPAPTRAKSAVKAKAKEKRAASAPAVAPFTGAENARKSAGGGAKSFNARTAAAADRPTAKTVGPPAKPPKKASSSIESSALTTETETKSRRQNRGKASRWRDLRARKKR